MSSALYQPLPRDEHDEERSSLRHRYISEHQQLREDPRFSPPSPPWWKRGLLILFILFLFWLYFTLNASMQKGAEPQIVHAHRYSKQHKYRPAASPVLYEKLKDGNIRVRGAAPSVRF